MAERRKELRGEMKLEEGKKDEGKNGLFGEREGWDVGQRV